MADRLRDEQLAFNAIRDELHKRSRRGFHALLALVPGGGAPRVNRTTGRVNNVQQGASQGKMAIYSIAAGEVARTLNDEERAVLRATGGVPAWFLPKVIAHARTIKM